MNDKVFPKNMIDNIINMIRPEFKQRSFNIFLQNYFGEKEIIACEIGVKSGVNAYNLLRNLNIKVLYLIDPYTQWRDPDGIKDYSNQEKKAHKLLRPFRDKVVFVKRTSDMAVDDLYDDYLDFVYVDGGMSYDVYLSDLKDYWSKLKFGGVIGGHNFVAGWESCNAVLDYFDKKVLMGGIDNCWWIIKT